MAFPPYASRDLSTYHVTTPTYAAGTPATGQTSMSTSDVKKRAVTETQSSGLQPQSSPPTTVSVPTNTPTDLTTVTQPSYLPTTASTATTQPAAVKPHPHPKPTVEHPPVKKEKPEAINILGMTILSNTANKSTHYSRPQAAKNCDLLLFDLAQDLSNDGILHLMSTLNTPTSQAHPLFKTMPEKALHHN